MTDPDPSDDAIEFRRARWFSRLLGLSALAVTVLVVALWVFANFVVTTDKELFGPHLAERERQRIEAASCDDLDDLRFEFAGASVRSEVEATELVRERALELECNEVPLAVAD